MIQKRASVHPQVGTPNKLEEMQKMFDQSPQTSTRQAARESGQARHSIVSALHKQLNYSPRNTNCVQ